jgi:ribosome maturation factor RimP
MRKDSITELLRPSIEDMGCRLWGVEFLSQGRHGLLRVFIDREGGVSVEDCERVSRQVGVLLDVEDPVQGPYTLEVSSPGMDRRLFEAAQYEEYKGAKVKIRLRTNFEGRRNFTGRLAGIEDGDVILQLDEDQIVLPLESVERANVVPEFDDNSR